jgi:hypothetical protein
MNDAASAVRPGVGRPDPGDGRGASTPSSVGRNAGSAIRAEGQIMRHHRPGTPALVGGLVLWALATPSLRAADEWTPGQNMRSSMVRLLAPVSTIVDKGEYGFSQTAYLGALLRPGGFSFLATTLNAGTTYLFIGAGSQPARDLDIVIEDDAGRVVASDVRADAIPMVWFTPGRTGRFTLRLKLAAANGACFCGMTLLEKGGGWQIPARNLDAAMDNMIAHCEGVASQRAAKFLDVPGEWAVIGTILREGKSEIFSDIRLGQGRRVIVAGGDTVTRDIDLAVFEDGPKRSILNADEDADASPLVQCVADAEKRYGVVIRNAKSDGGTMIMTALLDVQ